jgi:hypothetical protein
MKGIRKKGVVPDQLLKSFSEACLEWRLRLSLVYSLLPSDE